MQELKFLVRIEYSAATRFFREKSWLNLKMEEYVQRVIDLSTAGAKPRVTVEALDGSTVIVDLDALHVLQRKAGLRM